MNNPIYLDAAAATPLDPLVAAAMEPYYTERFFNASSAYKAARAVRADYENARGRIAHWLGAKPNEVIMTAGATESVNLALHGIMASYPDGRIAISAIEHKAALEVAKTYDHTTIPVQPSGLISIEALENTIDDKTVLVSIGYVNSEIGVSQPLRKFSQTIAKIRDDRKKRGIDLPLYFHTDASQTAGVMDLHVNRLGIDLMTLSATKIHGPKQVGLLFVKQGVVLQPLIHGGGQEQGIRSGTENVAGVIGFASAMDLTQEDRKERHQYISKLRDEFEARIIAEVPSVSVTAKESSRAPHISHITIRGIDAETLLFMMDEAGVMVATGAACAANKSTASHVLQAIGLEAEAIQGSIRCSFMHTLTEAEIAKAASILVDCLNKLLRVK